jgi:membrane associated rhomboid family serine protease
MMEDNQGNGADGHGGNGHDSGHDNGPDGGGRIVSFDRMKKPDLKKMQVPNPFARLPANDQPAINLPPMTKALLLTFFAIQIIASVLMSDSERYNMFLTYGFVPGYYTTEMGATLWQKLAGPLAYMFIHGSWMHVILNSLMLMAFGTGVEKWLGPRRMFVFFYACSLFAALVYFAVNPHSADPVIGASGGLSGLFAAILVLLQKRGQLASSPYGIWPFVALWIVISVIFGFVGAPGGAPVAWVAHIGGFIGGLALASFYMRRNRFR